jgi:pimeloyl-ACP methyl ester carboxylesterase
LNDTIRQAYDETGKKVHLIGHSLGGVLARAAAAQRRDRIASVITLASPFRGVAVHSTVLRAAELVRGQILERHGAGVLPSCYTGACTCRFLDSLTRRLPKSVRQTAIYTKTDGIVDWHVCRTDKPEVDFEVSSTHIGLVFNPIVYNVVAHRLAGKWPPGYPEQAGQHQESRPALRFPSPGCYERCMTGNHRKDSGFWFSARFAWAMQSTEIRREFGTADGGSPTDRLTIRFVASGAGPPMVSILYSLYEQAPSSFAA